MIVLLVAHFISFPMNQDNQIDLRSSVEGEAALDEPEFQIEQIDDHKQDLVGAIEPVEPTGFDAVTGSASHQVKVKFEKFVNLVATHAYEEIFQKYKSEDIVVSTDLLTDLANSHEEKEDRKVPMMFVFGILIGAVVVWILLKT